MNKPTRHLFTLFFCVFGISLIACVIVEMFFSTSHNLAYDLMIIFGIACFSTFLFFGLWLLWALIRMAIIRTWFSSNKGHEREQEMKSRKMSFGKTLLIAVSIVSSIFILSLILGNLHAFVAIFFGISFPVIVLLFIRSRKRKENCDE